MPAATTKPGINYWKIAAIVAVVGGLMFWARSCGIQSVMKTTGNNTIIYRDTTKIIYQPWFKEVIVAGKDGKDGKIIYRQDSVHYYEVRIDPADTAAILARYFEKAVYDDTINLSRGKIFVKDTVSENRIQGRSVMVDIRDTTITRTVTLMPPRRIVGYFTGSAMGNVQRNLYGVGAGFGVKLPSDMIYQAEVKLVQGQRPIYEGRVFLPIRLKRK